MGIVTVPPATAAGLQGDLGQEQRSGRLGAGRHGRPLSSWVWPLGTAPRVWRPEHLSVPAQLHPSPDLGGVKRRERGRWYKGQGCPLRHRLTRDLMSWGRGCPLQGAAPSSLGRVLPLPPRALPCELALLNPGVRGFFLGLSAPGGSSWQKPAEAASQKLPLLTGSLGQPLCASVPPSVKWARACDVQWD